MSKFGVDRQSNQGSFFNGTFPASYDSFYFMEIDAVPVRPFWLDQFIAEAVYNLQHPWLRWLYEQLELEQSTEFNAIAFDLRMANLSLEGREGTNADAAAAWAQHVPSDEDAANHTPRKCTGNYANTLLNSSFLAQTWKVEDPPRLLALQGSGPEKPRFDAGVYVRHGATSNIFENLNDSLVTLAAVSFDGSSGVYERFNQSLSVYHPFRKVLVISYGQHRVAPAGTVEVVAGDAGDAEVFTDTYHILTGPSYILVDDQGFPVLPYIHRDSEYCRFLEICNMSITVEVGLLSGKKATVEAGREEEVGSLKRRAHAALGVVGRGRLVDSSGSVLDPSALIKDAGVQDGDWLTLHINRVQVRATDAAFAAILGDGSVVAWGEPGFGGDSSSVGDQLKNVQQIQAASSAFAAILGDGSVVTWGDATKGGDSSLVQDKLKNVQQIQAADVAFAAILGDGSVVTWGNAARGGDSSGVQDQLKNVQQIQSSVNAFAAILDDGSVVTWGDAATGGDSSAVQDHLKNVQQIQASRHAFAAILGDGSVVTWGDVRFGGDTSAVQDKLQNVEKIQACNSAFAAILRDGSVVTWGDDRSGDSGDVQDKLKNVQQIQASGSTFAAMLDDGSVVTWGDARYGADSRLVQDQLKNVQQIQAASSACAAILGDGSGVSWGMKQYGGDCSAVRDQLKNVQQIQASQYAFAAILRDGSVVTWGDVRCGGNSRFVQSQLKDVQQIQANNCAFAAILGDGSVVTWGSSHFGGDSSSVRDQLRNL
ncbi:unnamed protein product [Symbiodinium sp. KB8]|nr:unnamed protein product [Symbiodinium sp. KB8]